MRGTRKGALEGAWEVLWNCSGKLKKQGVEFGESSLAPRAWWDEEPTPTPLDTRTEIAFRIGIGKAQRVQSSSYMRKALAQKSCRPPSRKRNGTRAQGGMRSRGASTGGHTTRPSPARSEDQLGRPEAETDGWGLGPCWGKLGSGLSETFRGRDWSR